MQVLHDFECPSHVDNEGVVCGRQHHGTRIHWTYWRKNNDKALSF